MSVLISSFFPSKLTSYNDENGLKIAPPHLKFWHFSSGKSEFLRIRRLILKDHQYIKAHFLGNDVAKKVKLIDLAYKWEDPPTPTRSTPLIKIEKQPIYFALKKVISPKYYKKKIKANAITKDQAIEQIIEILDIALMIRYQDTDEFENVLRNLETGDEVVDVFKNKIELLYF